MMRKRLNDEDRPVPDLPIGGLGCSLEFQSLSFHECILKARSIGMSLHRWDDITHSLKFKYLYKVTANPPNCCEIYIIWHPIKARNSL
jgi:hypothetical protein